MKRKEVLKRIKEEGNKIEQERNQQGNNMESWSILIGKEEAIEYQSIHKQQITIIDVLQYLEEYKDDREMITQLVYYLTLLLVEKESRQQFREQKGIEIISRLLHLYQDDLSIVKYCCSCLNNSGPQFITLPIIEEIETIQRYHPYDSFLKTVLCAAYANYSRYHVEILLQKGIVEWMMDVFEENIPTDVEMSLFAAFSNICRNSSIGQSKCVEMKLHERIIERLLNETNGERYWNMACNTLGCLSINVVGNERKEVVEYAVYHHFIDLLVKQVHLMSTTKGEQCNRLLTCLAKFCLVHPLFRTPSLVWLCYLSISQHNDENKVMELLKTIPPSLKSQFIKRTFVCHSCKQSCDPFVFRSIRFEDSLVLMSYCSLHCWFKRHELH